MKQRPVSQTITLITLVILAGAVSVICFLISTKPLSDEKMLEAKFQQLQGYDKDPAIEAFRTSEDGVAFLEQKLRSSDPTVRLKAIKALRQTGPKFTASEAGIRALCAALLQSDSEERSIAEGALGDLGPKAKAAVPALIDCISKGTDINGVWALGRIGPDAKAALPILESKMRQETGRERVYAAGAVWAIDGPNAEAKAVVKKALEDPDAHVRTDAHNVIVQSPEINPG